MNPPGHGHLSVCPLQAAGTEQGGISGEPADIRSPSDSPADRSCCGASLLGSQGTCSGPAAGIRAGEPRLGAAVVPLTFSARHTHAHMYIFAYINIYMCIYIHAHVHKYIRVHVCIPVVHT